jgi:isoleucyl-tRNA synthetase
VEVEDIETVHDAVSEHGAYIGQQTLAVEVICAAEPKGDYVVGSDVNDVPLKIAISKI